MSFCDIFQQFFDNFTVIAVGLNVAFTVKSHVDLHAALFSMHYCFVSVLEIHIFIKAVVCLM